MATGWWRTAWTRTAMARAAHGLFALFVVAASQPAACQPRTPLPQPVAVGSPSKPPPAVESTTEHPLTAVDLVSAEGEALLHADLDLARESPAYLAIKTMLEDKLATFGHIRALCGFDLIDQTHNLAASMAIGGERALIAARVDVTADALYACAAKAFATPSHHDDDDLPNALQVDGQRAVRLYEVNVGDTWMMATDGWLFIGHPTDLRRALERRKAPSRGTLHSFVRRRGHEVFAMVMDTTTNRLGRATVSVVFEEGRLDGVATITPNRELMAAERADDWLDQRLRHIRAQVTGLVDEHLSASHPLAAAARAMDWSVQDGTTTVRVSFALPPQLQAVLDGAVATWMGAATEREMRQVLSAVGRGATAAFEREIATPGSNQATHQLCRAAIDVPAVVPPGNSYIPVAVDGRDYHTGDRSAGWRCLRFELVEPQRFQLSYRIGGNYKGPARGGPDPGPHGYEVAVEADLDGDGKTSLMTLHGIVDPKTQRLRRSADIFVVDAGE